MEEQENEEQQQQSIANQVAEQGKEMAKQAVKDEIKKHTKKIAIKLAPFIIKAVIIILVASIIIGGVLAIIDTVREIASKISSSIATYIVAGENGPLAPNPEKMINQINAELEAAGIKKEELYLGNGMQADMYLYKFMAASLSTQLPYIKDSSLKNIFNIDFGDIASMTIPGMAAINNIKKQFTENVQGIVKIKRQTKGKIKDLTYKKHDDFLDLIEEDNTSALNYFSIDENWMLCVAKTKKVVTTQEPKIETEEEAKEKVIVQEVKIPYQTMVSKYSVPFEFFIVLQQVSQNAEYVSAVADLIRRWRN